MRLERWFTARNISDGTPSRGEITMAWLKRTRAVGREKRAKTSPVTTASAISPLRASMLTSTLDKNDLGAIVPYPIVAIVCTLKKKASAKEPGRALATPPSIM